MLQNPSELSEGEEEEEKRNGFVINFHFFSCCSLCFWVVLIVFWNGFSCFLAFGMLKGTRRWRSGNKKTRMIINPSLIFAFQVFISRSCISQLRTQIKLKFLSVDIKTLTCELMQTVYAVRTVIKRTWLGQEKFSMPYFLHFERGRIYFVIVLQSDIC